MVRKKQCAALIKLYDREIIRCLEPIYRDPEKGEFFEELVSNGRIEELKGETENAMDFAKQLFTELTESPLSKADNERLYKDVMAYLQATLPNSNVHQLLKCSDKSSMRSQFCIILNNLDGFLRYTNPEMVIAYLDAYVQYKDLMSAYRELEDRREEGEDHMDFMKKSILKMVPLVGEYAVYDIMYVISEKSSNDFNEEAKLFVEKILKLKRGGFKSFYASIQLDRRQCNGRLYICPIHESATEMLAYIGTEVFNSLRYRMINIRHDNIVPEQSVPRLIIQSVRNRIDLQRQLCLRSYQEELCRVALRGENTIVTAPTGSGKTVIAANILKNHFETREREGKRFKALFMTPNSMILKQQSDSISSYLDHAYHVQIIQGSDNVPVRNAIQSKDLIVATPQMIVNLCNEHKDELMRENDAGIEQFYLSTFTIIIFDECHSTVKNSPYSNIMREYHTLKNMGNMPNGHSLPQIIGLTASLGTGDGKNILGVREYIASLCANMDVNELSVVKENLDELRDYSPIIPDKVSYCERNTDGAIGVFTGCMIDMMKDVENLIRKVLHEEHIRVQEDQQAPDLYEREYRPTNNFVSPPNDKEHMGYLNWVCNQMNLVSVTKFGNNGMKISINEALAVLKECYLTLSYNINFNPEVALSYLRSEFENRSRNFTPEMSRIWNRYHNHLTTAGNAENSMILNVQQFTVDQNEQNPESRAIIFVQTRYEAIILNQILNKNERLQEIGIKSEWISGLNKSTAGNTEIASSKQKQADKLRKFANGEIRVLVSTSVAEEGLDVAECSLVIKYNYATNEIAHVQRRGRGRARNSTCVLITNSIALRDQESSNRDKENMMNQALAMIQSNPGAFKEMVTIELDGIWKRIVREDTERSQKVTAQINSNVTYRIVCKKCDTVLCTNHEIRARNTQYYVCKPEFWSLVRKIKLSDDELNQSRCYSTGKVLCLGSNCGSMLGRLIDVHTVELPCLGADAIVLINTVTEERFQVKKWKQILTKHFTPMKIRQLDLQIMKDANQARNPINFELNLNGIIENLIREL